jgi:hypothetical protein
MPLITRAEKGSKLTIAEMDGNLTYLQSNGFVDGTYTRIDPSLGIIEGVIGDTITYDPFGSATTGSYTITPTTLTGEGTDAEFELVVVSDGRSLRFSKDSVVINGGTGYAVGDTLRVPYSEIGGVSNLASDVVTFTLQEGSISDPFESSLFFSYNDLSSRSITTGQLQVKDKGGDPIIITFQGLPTEDPLNNGQLWNDSGSLKISAGV